MKLEIKLEMKERWASGALTVIETVPYYFLHYDYQRL